MEQLAVSSLHFEAGTEFLMIAKPLSLMYHLLQDLQLRHH